MPGVVASNRTMRKFRSDFSGRDRWVIKKLMTKEKDSAIHTFDVTQDEKKNVRSWGQTISCTSSTWY